MLDSLDTLDEEQKLLQSILDHFLRKPELNRSDAIEPAFVIGAARTFSASFMTDICNRVRLNGTVINIKHLVA